MADLYKGIYSHQPKRMKTHDYGSECWYMVTINTLYRKNYFGLKGTPDHGSTLHSTEIAHIARDCWNELPVHYPFVKLDVFIIMPDHIHAIVKIINTTGPKLSPNKFGTQKANLPSVVAGFKSSVKRISNKRGLEFYWQRNYHDRIIYTEEQLNNCRNYVRNNLTA